MRPPEKRWGSYLLLIKREAGSGHNLNLSITAEAEARGVPEFKARLGYTIILCVQSSLDYNEIRSQIYK